MCEALSISEALLEFLYEVVVVLGRSELLQHVKEIVFGADRLGNGDVSILILLVLDLLLWELQ
ncbi:MAG: hypothetical protein K9W43_02745 [Candidatus Thorarchaeota archaeon]|nr:hypothetical protein [Candidatus Thorarchaeota archaeon]